MDDKKAKRRGEGAGLFNFGREMFWALLMALVAIIYVIQAFRIPSQSMEDSLLAGDMLLGLKFIYGAPLGPFDSFGTFIKFPGIIDPKPGDVIIFRYPGTDRKDYIKRCVAGPGQTISTDRTNVYVDGKEFVLPPRGKYIHGGYIPSQYRFPPDSNSALMHFAPLRIPRRGDTITVAGLPVREFHFLSLLVKQEHPRTQVKEEYQIYADGVYGESVVPGRDPRFDDWSNIQEELNRHMAVLKSRTGAHTVEFKGQLRLGGKRIDRYVVQHDNYFMMGDNRDNSTDSRFWGYLNRNFVKAKAFILYFSLDQQTPFALLPLKIRWNRIGKLIRAWDGTRMVATRRAAVR